MNRRQHPISTGLVAAFAVIFALFATACVGPYSTTTQYVVHQEAYVQPPRGPALTGPFAEKGEIALEGSGYGTVRSEGEASRLEGAPGHIILDRGGGSRFVFGGLERLELGLGGSLGHSEFSTAPASDMQTDEETSVVSGSLDFHMRYLFAETDAVKLYMLGDLRTALVPFRRRVDVYEETTYHRETEDERRTSHLQKEKDFKNRLLLLPAGGVGGTVFVSRNAFVSFGGYGQDMPVFFGRTVTTHTCTNPTGDPDDEECSGKEPEDISPAERTLVGTAFGGFGVRIDKTTLKFQGYYHALSGSRWNDQVPGGGRVALRYTF